MKIEIEDYKGQTIFYNDETDKFECDIEFNNNVKGSKRASLKDMRKEIDQFIKLNLEFKPFKFLLNEYGGDSIKEYVCCAIRTDGQFVVHRKGDERYKSYYKLSDMTSKCYSYDADIISYVERIDKEERELRAKHKKDMQMIRGLLTPLDVSRYQI